MKGWEVRLSYSLSESSLINIPVALAQRTACSRTVGWRCLAPGREVEAR